jgi:aspartyl protease family protein
MWSSFLALAFATAADDTSLPETLTKHQLTRDGAYVVLPDEEKVHEEVAELKPKLRRLGDLEKKSQAAADYETQKKQNITQLKREHTQLTDALANLPQGDIARHNQLVVRINQIVALINRSDPDDEDQIKETRSEFESARAQVVKSLRSIGPRIDKLKSEYARLAADEEVTRAISELPEGAGKKPQLGPGRYLKTDSRDVEKWLTRLKSEEITLRGDSGVHFVDVILNDDTHAEFVLDTGAGMLCLPYELARKAGAEPTDEDPQVQMKIANGQVIPGRLVKIKSVRVGEFEVKDVDAAVLPESARGVEPLLGNSFLGNFEHQIDPSNNKLILSRWGEEKSDKDAKDSPRSKRRSRSKKTSVE